ncbi:MAG: WD40 repeat domain-containing protein [Planctomycetales bacterium]|nr:WD40 repeat domain-containing protein [Planctomycetales bacterium]
MRTKLALHAALLALLSVGAPLFSADVHVLRPDRAYDFQAVDHQSPVVVTALALSPAGDRIAASGDDHCIRLWDIASGAHPVLLKGHDDWVRGLSFDDQGLRLASAGDDRRLTVWDALTARPLIENQEAAGPIGSVAFLPGGQQLIAAAYGDKLRLLNVSSGLIDKQFPCACTDTRVTGISPDGRWLAAAGRSGTMRVWSLAAGGEGRDIPADFQRIHALAFSPDGKRVATGGNGNSVRLWDLTTGDLLKELPTRPAKVYSLLWLSDSRLAVGGTDNQIHLWDTKAVRCTHRLVGHTGTVAVLTRDASGKMLASGGFDTTVMTWRVPSESQGDTAAAGVTQHR